VQSGQAEDEAERLCRRFKEGSSPSGTSGYEVLVHADIPSPKVVFLDDTDPV
jgi:hypothetical protein